MAGFVISPQTIKVLLHFTLHGRPQLNVFHALYQPAGPLNPNIADTMFTAWKGSMAGGTPAYLLSFATTTIFTGIGVIDIRAPNNPEIISTTAVLAGTGVGTALPDQTAVCVTLRTAKTGRSHRGRCYTCGYTTAAVNPDGTIAANASAAALAIANSMGAAMTAAGAQLAVRSPALPERPSKPGGTLPAKDYEITPVSANQVRDVIWDTNRRRLDTLHR